jgi:hypothetical protein
MNIFVFFKLIIIRGVIMAIFKRTLVNLETKNTLLQNFWVNLEYSLNCNKLNLLLVFLIMVIIAVNLFIILTQVTFSYNQT